ncbi:MAG TPA: hypothetical protein DDZ39_02590 [Flavobacteriaceae bacterium]|nr:hypothetical protein [Flavobacteriaceae bacterium]HBS11535.1 hypothetical protein [Flavobacteriaceae bacterium]
MASFVNLFIRFVSYFVTIFAFQGKNSAKLNSSFSFTPALTGQVYKYYATLWLFLQYFKNKFFL